MNENTSAGGHSPESPAPLSSRLQGIADALTVRVAQLLAHRTRERLTPLLMDELRAMVAVAVRGAALEGARSATKTRAELLPVPKGTVTVRRLHAITVGPKGIDRIPKLPSGI